MFIITFTLSIFLSIFFIIRYYLSLFSNKKTIHIAFTGSIATGKTTTIQKFSEFLTKKGYKFYISTEIPMRNPKKLEWLYQDIKKNVFEYQIYLIIEYIKEMIHITNKKINIIIYDRTILDTLFFSNENLNTKEFEILNNLIKENLDIKFDHVIFIKPKIENMLKWQKKRNRNEESNVSEEYLKKIYNIFDNNINNFYKEYTNNIITFNNDNNIDLEFLFSTLI